MKATWEKDNEVYAEATTLFITPKTPIPSGLGEDPVPAEK